MTTRDLLDEAASLRAGSPLPPDDGALRDLYSRRARPRLAEVLSSIGLDLVYRKGIGDRLEYIEDGKTVEVLDLLAGYGAALLGHNHPELVRVAKSSLDERLPGHAQASCRGWAALLTGELGRLLARSVDRDYVVHLLNTGTEAVEAAVRHCELYRQSRLEAGLATAERAWRRLLSSAPRLHESARRDLLSASAKLDPALAGAASIEELVGRAIELNRAAATTEPVFLALESAYHGSGTAASKLSHGGRYHSSMSLTGIAVQFIPPDRPETLADALRTTSVSVLEPARDDNGRWHPRQIELPSIAGLFIEVVQGEGGIRVLDPDKLRAMEETCRRHGVLLVADEIQTGLGRTGAFLASEDAGLQPDLVLLSKVLGGGLAKVAAMAVAREVYVEDFSLQHASTFAEDDPSSRIALGLLELLDRDDMRLVRRCRRLGRAFLAELQQLQQRWPHVIAGVRGRGLMLGIEFAGQEHNPSATIRGLDASGALAAVASGWLLREERIRVAPALRHPRTLRIQPPLVFDVAGVRRTIAALDRLCSTLARGDIIELTRFLHGEVPATPLSAELGAPPTTMAPQAPPPDFDIGTPYALAHAAPLGNLPRIAFFSHFIDPASVRDWDPQLEPLSDFAAASLIDKMSGWTSHYPIHRFEVQSRTGQQVEAVVFGWPIMPAGYIDALKSPRRRERLLADLRDALAEAAGEGCRWVGFGGFTSILSSACRLVRNNRIRVTSGNSLTVGMAGRALERACKEKGLDLGDESVAILGGAGNLGRIHAHLLHARAGRLLLVGRSGSEARLEQIAEHLIAANGTLAPIEIVTDLARLRDCRVVVATSNAPNPIVRAEHIAKGPVVFLDVSVPGDAAPDLPQLRPEMLYIRGGIVRLPKGSEFSRLYLPGWHLPEGHAYACLAETLLLGLEGIDEDFSCGDVDPSRVHRIMECAARHGFELGDYQFIPSL